MGIRGLIRDLYRINFNFDSYLEEELAKGRSKEEVLARIARAEKATHLLTGAALFGATALCYHFRPPGYDKVAHALKGYLVGSVMTYASRAWLRLKRGLSKWLGLAGAAAEGIGYEFFELTPYFSQLVAPTGIDHGEFEWADALAGLQGGLLSFAISWHYDRKRAKLLEK